MVDGMTLLLFNPTCRIDLSFPSSKQVLRTQYLAIRLHVKSRKF